MEMQQHEQAPTAEDAKGPFFQGPVHEALDRARRSSGLVLVVSIQQERQGEDATAVDEACARLNNETWTDLAVQQRLAEATVALRLDWRSTDGANFLAIYPAFQVPTIYIISPQTGQPLDIIMGFVTPQQFLAKLNDCVGKVDSLPSAQTPDPMISSSTSTDAAQNTDVELQAPHEQPTSPSEVHPSPPLPDVAAQKERLLKKLEEAKKRKAAEEEQAEKERELARRRNGKAAVETIKAIDEAKRRKEMEERRKEKTEAQRHKEQVREKIRRDRELRAQQQAKEQPGATAPSPSASKPLSPSPSTNVIASSSAAIAFRFPDGRVEKAEFPSDQTLAHCRDYLHSVGLRGEFGLMTNFPRRVFTKEDFASTLLELGLCPSSTLIITGTSGPTTPSQSESATSAGSSGGGIFSGWASYLASFFAPAPTPTEAPQQTMATSGSQNSRHNGSNIHGLRRDTEGDDQPQGYWNGNSTQQY